MYQTILYENLPKERFVDIKKGKIIYVKLKKIRLLIAGFLYSV